MTFCNRRSRNRARLGLPRLAALVGVMVWCTVLTACSMPRIFRGPPDTVTRLSLVTSEYVNPNVAGDPSPVVLILYELAELSGFEGAEFNQLFYNDQQTLGGEVLIRQEFRVEPGQIMTMNRVLDPKTTHLGFVAGYRKIERKRWRLTVDVEPQTTQDHVIVIGSQALSSPKATSRTLGTGTLGLAQTSQIESLESFGSIGSNPTDSTHPYKHT